MIKLIQEGNCSAVKEDTYKIILDDVGNITFILKNPKTHVSAVLRKESALQLANKIINAYNGKEEFENV